MVTLVYEYDINSLTFMLNKRTRDLREVLFCYFAFSLVLRLVLF